MGTILFERFSKIFKEDVDRKIIENYKILGPIKALNYEEYQNYFTLLSVAMTGKNIYEHVK